MLNPLCKLAFEGMCQSAQFARSHGYPTAANSSNASAHLHHSRFDVRGYLSRAMLRQMFDLRQLRRFRRLGRVLAVCLGYALAVQTVVASVGTGMSAFTASAQSGSVVCAASVAPAPGRADDRQKPNPVPSCPFCFVAAQTAGHVALTDAAPLVPPYLGLAIAAVPAPVVRGVFVPGFRRTAGDPRAPPAFSA
jgi:hypothetical protein